MIKNISKCVKSISIATAYITMMRKTTRLQIGLQGGRLEFGYVVGKGDNIVGKMSSVRQKKPFDCVLSFTDDDQVSFYPVLIDQSSYCSEDIAFRGKDPQDLVFPRA